MDYILVNNVTQAGIGVENLTATAFNTTAPTATLAITSPTDDSSTSTILAAVVAAVAAIVILIVAVVTICCRSHGDRDTETPHSEPSECSSSRDQEECDVTTKMVEVERFRGDLYLTLDTTCEKSSLSEYGKFWNNTISSIDDSRFYGQLWNRTVKSADVSRYHASNVSTTFWDSTVDDSKLHTSSDRTLAWLDECRVGRIYDITSSSSDTQELGNRSVNTTRGERSSNAFQELGKSFNTTCGECSSDTSLHRHSSRTLDRLMLGLESDSDTSSFDASWDSDSHSLSSFRTWLLGSVDLLEVIVEENEGEESLLNASHHHGNSPDHSDANNNNNNVKDNDGDADVESGQDSGEEESQSVFHSCSEGTRGSHSALDTAFAHSLASTYESCREYPLPAPATLNTQPDLAEGQTTGQDETPGEGQAVQGHSAASLRTPRQRKPQRSISQCCSSPGHSPGQGQNRDGSQGSESRGHGHSPGKGWLKDDNHYSETQGQGRSLTQGYRPRQGRSPSQSNSPVQGQSPGQGYSPAQGQSPGQGYSPGQGHTKDDSQCSGTSGDASSGCFDLSYVAFHTLQLSGSDDSSMQPVYDCFDPSVKAERKTAPPKPPRKSRPLSPSSSPSLSDSTLSSSP